MPFCEWDEENWETLIYTIQKKKCILMLGPDAVCEHQNGRHIPLTETLAIELAKKIDRETKKKIDVSDLMQASQYYCMNKGRSSLENKVINYYRKKEFLNCEIHSNLSTLPFPLVVTATHDNILKAALEREGKTPIIESYRFKGKNSPLVEIGTVEKPLLFYLYGNIEEPNSLVLTEYDLLDFLVGLISNKRPLPENILSELKDESKSFLFLGFGFVHWYLRILLYILHGGNKNSTSFAFEQFMPTHQDQFTQTVFFYQKSNFNTHIFKKDFKDFAVQLRERFEKKPATLVNKVPSTQSPLVFICHAKEDKDIATFLNEKLKHVGLNPWLDEEKLLGGEDWDKEIKKIAKQVDYFLILHSRNLENKHMGYVIKEINYALERRKEFRRGIRFIIPIKTDNTPLKMEELKDIQTFDFTDRNKIESLISIIKRDFAKRMKG